MSGNKSRDKGQRGEREIIAFLQPIVNEVFGNFRKEAPILQRNQLQTDRGGSDIIATDQFGEAKAIRWLAAEVKWCETFALEAWWKQCVKQANTSQTPVLFYKRNNVQWRVRMGGACFDPINGCTVYSIGIVDISLELFGVYFKQRMDSILGLP
jgi:hypothetical protein